MSIGESVAEPLRIHGMRDPDRRRRIVEDLLERVGLSGSDADRYPHELSGGMKQRVALARALSVNPDLLVADEPVSALDVSVQAEILSLLADLQAEFDLGVVLISHDMGVVRQVCDRVNVMYLGEIVERGPTEAVFDGPEHPYTEALMSSIPQPDPRQRGRGIELTGDVPSPSNPPPGCRFHTRCHRVIPPEGYEFEGREWRRVMDLRGRLRRGALDVEELLERHEPGATGGDGTGTGTRGVDGGDPAAGTDEDRVAAAVRAEFDLPDRLSDASAESTVAEALADLAAGNPERARERLAEAFPTVCEREHPELRPVGEGRTAACHLHGRGRAEESPTAED
jgi:peptide/nickel transport system ATP-binding protein